MIPTAGIYEITSPTGKIYIGQSKDIDRRWDTYRKMRKNRIGSALYTSFLKHGVENHIFKVIIIISIKGGRKTLDHFEKLMIASARRIAKSLNMTDGGCGSWGYKHSEEAKKLLAFLGTGERSGKAKAVTQMDLNGDEIRTYCTITEAAKSVGVSAPSISAVLRGITHKSAGFKWKYKSTSHYE